MAEIATRRYSEIRHAEWIIWNWIEVTTLQDSEPIYMRGRFRPLDEAMKLSGGSIKTLKPYLWAQDSHMENHKLVKNDEYS